MAFQKVLIVEDNDADLTQAKIWLDGYQVATAATLAEARQVLGQQRFDVILLDLHLPDSSGVESIEGVRAVAGGAGIVVLTGMDDEQLAMEAIRAGAHQFVGKSEANLELVLMKMRHAVERAGLPAQPTKSPDKTMQVVMFDDWKLVQEKTQDAGETPIVVSFRDGESRVKSALGIPDVRIIDASLTPMGVNPDPNVHSIAPGQLERIGLMVERIANSVERPRLVIYDLNHILRHNPMSRMRSFCNFVVNRLRAVGIPVTFYLEDDDEAPLILDQVSTMMDVSP